MRRNLRTVLGAALVAAVLAALVLLARALASPSGLPLPNPNGYKDFAKAAKMLVGDLDNFNTLDRDRLRDLVSSNAEPLRLMRLGLSRKCVVPYDAATVKDFGPVLGPSRSLTRLLAAAGRLAELEHRPGDAAHSYAEAIRFGTELGRGGVVIHRLVGIACEGIGSSSLGRILPQLGCAEARPAIRELENVAANGVPWDDLRRKERAFLFHHLEGSPAQWFREWRDSREVDARAELMHKKAEVRVRLLAAELALRCYVADHGRAPSKLDELVPSCLTTVPTDPFTSQPMVYRAQGTNWMVYSVGPDGVDDGGRRAGRDPTSKGDLFFDSL